MKLYVAGPMRGIPNFNFDAFDEAARFYRLLRHRVYSPAERDRQTWPDMESWPGYAAGEIDRCPAFDFKRAIRWDLSTITRVDGVVLLDGWERSSGARLERQLAEACGLHVFEDKVLRCLT